MVTTMARMKIDNKYTLSEIKLLNTRKGGYFFSRSTMKFFGNTMKDFRLRHVMDENGLHIYVINTVGGCVHEFDAYTADMKTTKLTASDFGISTRPYPKGRWGF
jgi:hypothetical protein